MKIKFYGYRRCSTCRNAEKWLENEGYEVHYIDITEAPPSISLLKKALKGSEGKLTKIFNTSGLQYKALGMKDKLPKMTKEKALKLLSGNGKLVKRPITIASDGRVTVGFRLPQFEDVWKK